VALYKFGPSDIFYNQVLTSPACEFLVYDGAIYYNKRTQISGAFSASIVAKPGHISLYEMNVDRVSGSSTAPDIIYPFVTKDGALAAFKTVSSTDFATNFGYGNEISGTYPMTASIIREYFCSGCTRPHVDALRNTMNFYKKYSHHFAYSSSARYDSSTEWNKAHQEMGLISIPSIFYGNRIKKGTIELEFHISGNLIGKLEDPRRNGELIQTGPSGSTGSGSVAGVVLYSEGFFILTGSWAVDSVTRSYISDATEKKASAWIYFGAGAHDGIPSGQIPSASFNIRFRGENNIPVVTMLAHAPVGKLNYSNNPTFIKHSQSFGVTGSASGSSMHPMSSSYIYKEKTNIRIANTISSSFLDPTGSFERQTFISKIGLYDENKNLIGITSVATPVKKRENRALTFKLKMDF